MEMSVYNVQNRNGSVIIHNLVGVGGEQYIDIKVHSLQSRNSVLCQKCHITEFTYSFRNARPTIPTADKIHQTKYIVR